MTARHGTVSRSDPRGSATPGAAEMSPVPLTHRLQALSRLRAVDWSPSYVGLLIYVFAVTTYRLPLGTAGMVVGILGLVFERGAVRLPPPLLWFAAFVSWAGVGALLSVYPEAAQDGIILLAKLWLVMFVAINALRTPARVWFFLVFFLACFATHPARGAIFNYLSGYSYLGRALWINEFENANQLAALALLQLSIATGLVSAVRKGAVRWGAIASVAVLPVVILMTQSRGGFIALGTFALLVVSAHRRRLRAFATAAIVAAAAAMIAPGGVWDRVGGLGRAFRDNALEIGRASCRERVWIPV